MTLDIQIKKRLYKPSILTCVREDGSSTYAQLHTNLEIHDIAHFVVESQLEYKQAFYGLVAQGYSISDFQLPKEERPNELHPNNLHPEALITEHMVNLLQINHLQLGSGLHFLKDLKTILQKNTLPFPSNLTSKKLIEITEELTFLMGIWGNIDHGGVLKLPFRV